MLGRAKLDDLLWFYASGQPCPMCLKAAMRMAGISQIFYAYSNDDAPALWITSTANIAKALRVAPEQQEGLQFIANKT